LNNENLVKQLAGRALQADIKRAYAKKPGLQAGLE